MKNDITTGRATETEETASRLYIPEKSGVDWVVALLLSAFAVYWVRPLFTYIGLGSDEGIVLQGAVRILRGELPYRDFFSFYTPGSFYLHASIFHLFGTSERVARSLLIVYAALFAVLTYMLSRRVNSRRASAVAALLLSLICLSARFQNLHNWDSTAAALLSVYCAIWFLQTNRGVLAFLTGLFAGASLMIDQSKGSGLLLGLAIAVVVLWRTRRELWIGRHLLYGVTGAALPTLVVITYFGTQGALHQMLAAWLWPLSHYTGVNSLPYGYNHMGHALIDALAASTTLERAIIVIVFSGMTLILSASRSDNSFGRSGSREDTARANELPRPALAICGPQRSDIARGLSFDMGDRTPGFFADGLRGPFVHVLHSVTPGREIGATAELPAAANHCDRLFADRISRGRSANELAGPHREERCKHASRRGPHDCSGRGDHLRSVTRTDWREGFDVSLCGDVFLPDSNREPYKVRLLAGGHAHPGAVRRSHSRTREGPDTGGDL